MTTKASGDFLRANDPGVLTRLETLEEGGGGGTMTGAEILVALGPEITLEGWLQSTGPVYAGQGDGMRHSTLTHEGLSVYANYDESVLDEMYLNATAMRWSDKVREYLVIDEDTNIRIGHDAGKDMGTGISENVLLGLQTGRGIAGPYNVALGSYAMQDVTGSPDSNVAVGYEAMYEGDGSQNVAIGRDANFQAHGSGNVAVGANASTGNASNAVAIGKDVTVSQDGETNINNAFCARTVTLTAADLADLGGTPFKVVPERGSGKILLPMTAFYVIKDVPEGVPQNGTDGATLTYGDTEFHGVFTDPDANTTTLITSNVLQGPALFGSLGSIPSVIPNGYDGPGSVAGFDNKAIYLRLYNEATPLNISGAIVTSAIAAAGTGYVALEELTIGDATIRIDTVGGSGEVLTYTVTTAGTNNIIGTAQATTGGSGADFTVDITALDYSVNPMMLTIKTLYSVMELPEV